jgi:beta-glucosidase/6-phospho-beta-glucosidase/beta-galactosidase
MEILISLIYNSELQANSIWLYIVPQSMRTLMNYVKQKYGNPPVFITENGNLQILIISQNSSLHSVAEPENL